jgi:hypothetical protein
MGTTAKGQPAGLATLDTSGKLPAGQLPSGMGAEAGAVADLGALTTSAAAALTAAAAAGAAPDDDEFDALLADVTQVRAKLNLAIADLGTMRTKVNALLASLRAAGLLDT